MAEPGRRGFPLRYTLAALACIGAVIWMLTLMRSNVVFFKTVSQAVSERASDRTHSLRIGGAVVPGSIHQRNDGAQFDLTQGNVTVHVDHHGDEPALFQDCAPVVAEGRWDHDTFVSSRLLIKHGSSYEPPKDAKPRCPEDPFKR